MRMRDSLSKIAATFDRFVYALESFKRNYETDKQIEGIRKITSNSKDYKENEEKVQKNIDDWRDFLHKYSLILMSIAGFFVALLTLTKESVDWVQIKYGFLLLGISITLTFITIFTTLFLQRKIIDGNFYFGLYCTKPWTEHEDKTLHYTDAMRINLEKWIISNAVKLVTANNLKKHQEKYLKNLIKTDRKVLRGLKYSGGTYKWFEYVRVWSTIIILVTSFWGIYKIATEILSFR